MSISTPFIRRPIATSLLMAAIFLVGSWPIRCCRSRRCRRSTFPTIQVTAQLPGASPETMASSVAQPLETAVRADLRRLADDLDERARHHRSRCSSTSNRNIDAAAQDVQAAINAAGGSCRRTCRRRRPTARSIPADSPILILAVHSDVLPLTTVDDYAENISRSRSRRSPASRRCDRRPAEAGGPRADRSRPSSPRWA
jgi:hydrophobic/amphiphilic exporter-1 (mainly G- bacteria), HAE1 family